MPYAHKKIEKKWQKEWEQSGIYKTLDKKSGAENFYALVEFPYPSGNLHTGHWYAFSVPDIFARKKKMEGKNVLFPIGFDAFGLPAENAAIQRKINPKKWTYDNIEYMRRQIKSMGASFDWSREVITCDPEYYKWTQWIFLKFFEKGLAYQAETPVNWCPKDKTVLANEQVVGGKCERCDAPVEQKNMKQWMLKIADYAERLLSGLEKLNWREEIKEAQRNWIGKSEGTEAIFGVENFDSRIKIVTTRVDTIFGATFIVLAPEHSLITQLRNKIKNFHEVENYAKTAARKTEFERGLLSREKTGVKLEGLMAVNPASGKRIPIFVSDFVLATYGTGAIMSVPAHDQRDFDFAKKFNLPILQVVKKPKTSDAPLFVQIYDEDNSEAAGKLRRLARPKEYATPNVRVYEIAKKKIAKVVQILKNSKIGQLSDYSAVEAGQDFTLEFNPAALSFIYVYEGDGQHINSGFLDGLNNDEAIKKMTSWLVQKKIGKPAVHYRLHDWVVSRQRYWGAPIPVIHCPKDGAVAAPEGDLPVLLPEIKDYKPRFDGKSPLAKATKWLKVKCPKCGGDAERETDTLDTFVDSSWYFLRYLDPKNKKEFTEKAKMKNWLPVDLYSGGAEHTTMHLLYSRFWYKAMFDLGLILKELGDEPYAERRNRGIILGPDGQKMSKSRGNVVDPDEYVAKFGADTVRMYLAFIGPYSEVGSYPWNPRAILGIRRFLERVYKLANSFSSHLTLKGSGAAQKMNLARFLNQTVKKVGKDIDAFRFNTAISALMVLLNEFEKYGVGLPAGKAGREAYSVFLRLLAPFAPHLAEEFWQKLGNKTSIHLEPWPKYDPKLIEEETFELIVQINGKVRDKFEAPTDISKTDAERLTLAREKVKLFLENKNPKRIVFVPKKLINIVI